MDLFVVGLGYTALHFLRSYIGERSAGTVRSPEKADRLRREGIEAFVFDERTIDPAVKAHVARTSALLVSSPPGETGDPVLATLSDTIRSAQYLQCIVYLSTVGVYGDHSGAWVDETTTPNPSSPRSQARLAAEKAWCALGRASGKRVHILRLAGIYGPGRNALLNLQAGRARRIIKPGQVFNRIHVDDIGRAIVASLAFRGEAGRADPQVWNVADDDPAPAQDVVEYAASLMGIEPPPATAFDFAGLSLMARSFYGENKRVSNLGLKQNLGVTLAFPTYREGLRALWNSGEGRGAAESS